MSSINFCTSGCRRADLSRAFARSRSTGWPMRATLSIDIEKIVQGQGLRPKGQGLGLAQEAVPERVHCPSQAGLMPDTALGPWPFGLRPSAIPMLPQDER